MTFRAAGAAVLLCASISVGQHLTFEVASIKPAAPQAMARIQMDGDGGPGTRDPGRIRFTDMTLKALIMSAYNVQSFQVSGPSWIDGQHFDIIAKVPLGATRQDAKIMLQNLLADRFNLKLHKTSKEASIFELVVAKSGVRLKEAAAPAENAPPRNKEGFLRTPHGQLGIQATAEGRMRIRGDAVTMARLADILGMALSRPVVDKTGLSGTYDITLNFSRESIGPGPKGPGGNPAEDTSPSIFTALQQQLGLKLESRKGPAEVLIVDSAKKMPTEN